ncbi:MAG: DUF3137 domain-containing protein [Campylobacter sp.]|nr:DUF3137 domain-containing protein [Campylobacter sp.]
MNINELENLRLKILKEIKDKKFFVILATFIIPIMLLWVFIHTPDDFMEHFFMYAYAWCGAIIFLSIVRDIQSDVEKGKSVSIKRNIFPFLVFISMPYLTINFEKHSIKHVLFFMFVAMTTAYFVIMKHIKEEKINEYIKAFKGKYLKTYFEKLDYKYEFRGFFELNHILSSGFFRPNEVTGGKDTIYGKIDGVEFGLFDIDFHKKVSDYLTYGVFFYAEFNKNINSTTFIKSKDSKIKNIRNLQKIIMDNTEFNDIFDIYSNDIQNAMYIFSPAFMKRILELKKWHLDCPINMSFVGNKIYIFIDTGRDNFEPDINTNATITAKTIKVEFSHFLSIVKTLNLNTRIWKI